MNRSHHGAHLCVEGDEGGLAGGDVVFGCDKVVCGVLLVDADLPSLDRCVVARRRQPGPLPYTRFLVRDQVKYLFH